MLPPFLFRARGAESIAGASCVALFGPVGQRIFGKFQELACPGATRHGPAGGSPPLGGRGGSVIQGRTQGRSPYAGSASAKVSAK